MKLLSLVTVSALALLAATPAFAQDSRSTIDQQKDGNVANVTQIGANTADSFVRQNGINNRVDVTQSGRGNASVIDQIDFVGNNFPDPIINNRATVNQSGINTFSDIRQDGRRNVAEVTITGQGSDNGIQPPRPDTFQDFRDRQNRESDIEQIGDDNFARLTQHADFSRSSIRTRSTLAELRPSGNSATVTQDRGGFNLDSEVEQSGKNNTAFVYQSGSNNVSDVKQEGEANFADVSQIGVNAVSSVVQNGNLNSATVRQ